MTSWLRALAWLRQIHPVRLIFPRPTRGFAKYVVAPRLGAFAVRRRLLERLAVVLHSAGAEPPAGS